MMPVVASLNSSSFKRMGWPHAGQTCAATPCFVLHDSAISNHIQWQLTQEVWWWQYPNRLCNRFSMSTEIRCDCDGKQRGEKRRKKFLTIYI
jgi:hypothetical protein